MESAEYLPGTVQCCVCPLGELAMYVVCIHRHCKGKIIVTTVEPSSSKVKDTSIKKSPYFYSFNRAANVS